LAERQQSSLELEIDPAWAKLLSYPYSDSEEASKRLEELAGLGISEIIPTGETFIGGYAVLGKGCTSIVTLVMSSYGKVALKIRRLDSNRESCASEARILREANEIGVGPRLLQDTDNFLLMEFIDGTRISSWLPARIEEGRLETVAEVLKEVLEDCYRLDIAGIDHGQLVSAGKHIIVRSDGKPVILDFESASTIRKAANVTSVSHYFLLGSKIADRLRLALGLERDIIIDCLREYRWNTNRDSFEDLLKEFGLST